MPSTKLTIREYLTARGSSPFRDWLDGLDLRTRARIQARVLRFETGNLGDHKPVGGGVWEARLPFGSGYRIYARLVKPSSYCWSAAIRPPSAATFAGPGSWWNDYLEAMQHGKAQ